MGLNNNYGFKTLDKDGVVLNGKWPIFGFDIEKVADSWRTTRISDSSFNDWSKPSDFPTTLTPPSDQDMTWTTTTDPTRGYVTTYGSCEKTQNGVVRRLITQYKHGYNYRPSGYYTISGNLVLKADCVVEQYGTGTWKDRYGGSFHLFPTYSINYNKINSCALYPAMNDFIPYAKPGKNSRDYNGGDLTPFYPNRYSLSMKLAISSNSTGYDITTPMGSWGNLFSLSQVPQTASDITASAWFNKNDDLAAWVDVEIDNEYVKIYMNYRWYDYYIRDYEHRSAYDWQGTHYDAETRIDMIGNVQMITLTTGSNYDVTVYLTPHKLEDMIING